TMAALKVLTPLALIALLVVGVRADDKKKEDKDKPAKAGYLGVKFDQNQQEAKGIKIMEVVEDGPAAKAGLKADDAILKVDGKEVADFAGLREAVGAHKPGDKIKLTVKRGDKEMEITVTAGERPPDQDK